MSSLTSRASWLVCSLLVFMGGLGLGAAAPSSAPGSLVATAPAQAGTAVRRTQNRAPTSLDVPKIMRAVVCEQRQQEPRLLPACADGDGAAAFVAAAAGFWARFVLFVQAGYEPPDRRGLEGSAHRARGPPAIF